MRRWDLSKWEKIRVSSRMVGFKEPLNYERFKNSCRVSFELMREQNLGEEEQRTVGGIWLNRLCDQLQPLADIQPEGVVGTI